MTVLGIDPGTLATGYAVIESRSGSPRMITSGVVTNTSTLAMSKRLENIFHSLTEVIKRYHPDECAIETAFYGKNAQSALKLGHARGVAILAAVIHTIPTHEYAPREIKRAIVGNGNASKDQVRYMVKALLGVKELPRRFDITDALAVAVCHLHRRMMNGGRISYRSWKSFVRAHPELTEKAVHRAHR